tara:strand:+ start:818 stop:2233 length:1416 start_codon:yes stop_codon:yes gene_type:complete
MVKNSNRVVSLIVYLLLVTLGTITVFYQINFEGLWFDEMNSFYVADPNLTLQETLLRHNESDWHNPKLFNLILKNYFKLVGYDPSLARYIPLIFGSISLLMFGAISYQIKKDNSFLITTFLACISIYIIKYSQEIRPYSLLLLTSSLNIFFYIKLINQNKRKTINSIFFIFFSVLNYSTHPFSLIILFSQIFFSLYRYFFYKNPFKFFLFLYLLIFIFYLLLNFNYILIQISFENYMLSHDIKNVLDGLYFPRFFGSKIMGYIYLTLLFFLLYVNKKIIFNEKKNYLFFLFLLIFSYLVPFTYGIINTPVLHDRYIIFILIPILVLVSCLLSELSNNRLKLFLTLFILIFTLTNHYIEIFKRPITKPQFGVTLENIKKSGVNNIVLYSQTDSSYLIGDTLITNYVENIDLDQKKNLNFYDYNDLSKELKIFWLICYKPNLDYDCKISENDNYNILKSQSYYQVESFLYKKK